MSFSYEDNSVDKMNQAREDEKNKHIYPDRPTIDPQTAMYGSLTGHHGNNTDSNGMLRNSLHSLSNEAPARTSNPSGVLGVRTAPHLQKYHDFSSPAETAQIAALFILWYRRHGRRLPWRLPYTVCPKGQDPAEAQKIVFDSLSLDGTHKVIEHARQRAESPFLRVLSDTKVISKDVSHMPKIYLEVLKTWCEHDNAAEEYLSTGYREFLPVTRSKKKQNIEQPDSTTLFGAHQALHRIAAGDVEARSRFPLTLSPSDLRRRWEPIYSSQLHDLPAEKKFELTEDEKITDNLNISSSTSQTQTKLSESIEPTSKEILPIPPNGSWTLGTFSYGVWVSEIMLQQTRVETVKQYYWNWMKTFPTIRSLAEAPQEEITKCWAGLGYYRRSRLLQEGARFIVDASRFTSSEQESDCQDLTLPASASALRQVPGIGPYTSGAIASVVFGLPEPVVDGNVFRVLSRLRGLNRNPLTDNTVRNVHWRLARELVGSTRALDSKILTALANTHPWILEAFGHKERKGQTDNQNRYSDDFLPAEFNQALMELGATVCVPIKPLCEICPVKDHCHARREFDVGSRPFFNSTPDKATQNYIFDIEDTSLCNLCDPDTNEDKLSSTVVNELEATPAIEKKSQSVQTSLGDFFSRSKRTGEAGTITVSRNVENVNKAKDFSSWVSRYPGPKQKKAKVIARLQAVILTLRNLQSSSKPTVSESVDEAGEQILFVRTEGASILSASRQHGTATNTKSSKGSGSALLEGQWSLPAVVLNESHAEDLDNSDDDEQIDVETDENKQIPLGMKRQKNSAIPEVSLELRGRVENLLTVNQKEGSSLVLSGDPTFIGISNHLFSHRVHNTEVFVWAVEYDQKKGPDENIPIDELDDKVHANRNSEQLRWVESSSASHELGLPSAVSKQLALHTKEVTGRAAVASRRIGTHRTKKSKVE